MFDLYKACFNKMFLVLQFRVLAALALLIRRASDCRLELGGVARWPPAEAPKAPPVSGL